MKITKAILITIALSAMFWYVRQGMYPTQYASTEFSDSAVDATKTNTARSLFVKGCLEGFDNESFCTCAFNAILELHPDFGTNTEKYAYMYQTGYSQTETDAVVNNCPVHQTLTN